MQGYSNRHRSHCLRICRIHLEELQSQESDFHFCLQGNVILFLLESKVRFFPPIQHAGVDRDGGTAPCIGFEYTLEGEAAADALTLRPGSELESQSLPHKACIPCFLLPSPCSPGTCWGPSPVREHRAAASVWLGWGWRQHASCSLPLLDWAPAGVRAARCWWRKVRE